MISIVDELQFELQLNALLIFLLLVTSPFVEKWFPYLGARFGGRVPIHYPSHFNIILLRKRKITLSVLYMLYLNLSFTSTIKKQSINSKNNYD